MSWCADGEPLLEGRTGGALSAQLSRPWCWWNAWHVLLHACPCFSHPNPRPWPQAGRVCGSKALCLMRAGKAVLVNSWSSCPSRRPSVRTATPGTWCWSRPLGVWAAWTVAGGLGFIPAAAIFLSTLEPSSSSPVLCGHKCPSSEGTAARPGSAAGWLLWPMDLGTGQCLSGAPRPGWPGATVHPLPHGASLLGPSHWGPQRSVGGRAGPCLRRGPTVPCSSSPVSVLSSSSSWTSTWWHPHTSSHFPGLALSRHQPSLSLSQVRAGATQPATQPGLAGRAAGVAEGAELLLQLCSQPWLWCECHGCSLEKPLSCPRHLLLVCLLCIYLVAWPLFCCESLSSVDLAAQLSVFSALAGLVGAGAE